MNIVLATGTSGTIGKHLPPNVIPIKQNLSLKKDTFKNLSIQANSNLIHLAGVVGPSAVESDVNYARQVNIDGTVSLAEEFLAKSTGQFYFVSTSHVYAPSQKKLSESSPLSPGNIYAEQKLETEIILREVFRNELKRLCIIRLFSVLDWDVAPFTLGGAIKKLANEDDGFILRNGLDVRDFLAPTTIAKSLYKIASQGKADGVINLCTSNGISVGEAARKMLTLSGLHVQERRIIWELSDNPIVVGDNSRLKSIHPDLDLTWCPSGMNEGAHQSITSKTTP